MRSAAFRRWRRHQIADLPALKPNYAAQTGIKRLSTPRYLYAISSYYRLILEQIAATALGISSADSATHHIQRAGYANYAVIDGLPELSDADLAQGIQAELVPFCFDDTPPDALKGLYHDLFPRKIRYKLGEYYTPDWLVTHILNTVDFQPGQRMLDPTCGSGTFLALALHMLPDTMSQQDRLNSIAGVDIQPLAVLAAQTNIILALGRPQQPLTLPVNCADVILSPPDIGTFDLIAGNPPWVNWEQLTPEYRERTRNQWEALGLFPHEGFTSILGKGKKDLSLLVTLQVTSTYLKQDGRFALILTQSALKSSGAGDGFRRLRTQNRPFRINRVDDLTPLHPFPRANARTIVVYAQTDRETEFPVHYVLWRSNESRYIDSQLTLADVYQQLNRVDMIAEPIEPDDMTSPWISGTGDALRAVRKLSGSSDYAAHAGAYTGGANGVYWLEILERDGDRVRVRNLHDSGRRKISPVTAWVEADMVFPLLRSDELNRWHAQPGAYILMPQDMERRRGYPEAWLQEHYPLTYAYLLQFKSLLKQRAAYRRYFKKSTPFYSMFDTGTYTLSPVKVVWQGLGVHEMRAAVITTQDNKPIMTNQAVQPFIAVNSEDEAHYLAACLNSPPFEYAVISHTQSGGKSFAQPGIMTRLRIPTYNPDDVRHQRLTALSRLAHQNGETPQIMSDISALCAALWELTSAEHRAVDDALHALRRE